MVLSLIIFSICACIIANNSERGCDAVPLSQHRDINKSSCCIINNINYQCVCFWCSKHITDRIFNATQAGHIGQTYLNTLWTGLAYLNSYRPTRYRGNRFVNGCEGICHKAVCISWKIEGQKREKQLAKNIKCARDFNCQNGERKTKMAIFDYHHRHQKWIVGFAINTLWIFHLNTCSFFCVVDKKIW